MEWTKYAQEIAREFVAMRPENFVDLWRKYQDYGGRAGPSEFHALIHGEGEAFEKDLFLLKAAFEDISK
ncbi:hypothetical protein [Pseudarthrobacter sp. YAF2]|uniref:hypothetical protein n=1 Tax=Pseudarthrobacter sp. YAF2 TaxID=3233078 RepID=UPI003F9C9B05